MTASNPDCVVTTSWGTGRSVGAGPGDGGLASIEPRQRAPCDVGGDDALTGEELGGLHAPGTTAADDESRTVSGDLRDTVGHLGERDQHRARHVIFLVLVGLADVDDRGAALLSTVELLDVDLVH